MTFPSGSATDGSAIYDWVSYKPGDSNYNNDFGFDYSGILFYAPSSKPGRYIDNGGIQRVGNTAVSTHVKTTTEESIVDSKFGLDQMICDDGLSTMLIQIRKEGFTSDPLTRVVRLLAPFVISDGYSLISITNLETKIGVRKVLDKFYSRTLFAAKDKLANHELFLLKLVSLINSELKGNIKYSGRITSKDILRQSINKLLSDGNFQETVITEAGYYASKYFKGQLQGQNTRKATFNKLISFLTRSNDIDQNFDKIAVQTSSGQYKLSLTLDYNPHFKTDDSLDISDFDANTVGYVEIDDSNQPIVRDGIPVTISEPLLVGHIEGKPDFIVLIPLSKLNNLKDSNINEGFLDKTGKVIHAIFACDGDGKKLISKFDYENLKTRDSEDKFWFRPYYQLEFAFDEETNMIVGYDSKFFGGYVFIEGNDIKATLQDTKVRLKHIDSYKDPLHNLAVKEISNLEGLDRIGFYLDSRMLNDLYGPDFTLETQFDIFYDLLDYTGHTQSEPTISLLITKFLHLINGYMKGDHFETGPNLETINKIIKDLFYHTEGYYDWTELNKFIYKTSDGENYNYDLYKKEWLDLYLTKVLGYPEDGSNDAILKEQKFLKDRGLEGLDPLGVSRNRQMFTESERKKALSVLASATRLLGHGTIKFILLGMSDLNNDVSLRIIKRANIWSKTSDDSIIKRMYHIGLVPPRGDYYRESGDRPYSPISTGFHKNTMEIEFGSIFLDAHLCFRMDNDKNEEIFTHRQDSHIFPRGPIPISGISLTGTSQREVSWKIAQTFVEMYTTIHGGQQMMDKQKIFIEKQLNLIKIFEKIVWRQVLNDPTISEDIKYSMIYKFINEIRADLLNFEARDGLLERFYDFLDSKKHDGYIALRNGYKLYLDLDEFQGENIIRWHGLGSGSFKQDFGNFKRINFIEPTINNFVEMISNLILDVGGEVEVFPLYYVNDKLGYRGYVNTWYKHIPNSFSLNLENTRSGHVLDFMGNLMLAYPVIYIVSEKGSTWNNNKMLFAFNQWGFVKVEEIYSNSPGKGRIFNSRYPVILSNIFPDPNSPGQYISFYDAFPDPVSLISTSYWEKYNSLWRKKGPILIGITSGSNSEFFNYYFDEILGGTTEYDRTIRSLFEEQ